MYYHFNIPLVMITGSLITALFTPFKPSILALSFAISVKALKVRGSQQAKSASTFRFNWILQRAKPSRKVS